MPTIRNVAVVLLIALTVTSCGGRKRPPKGGGTTGGGSKPPGEQRFTLEEWRARQRTLANALKLHPSDRSGALIAVHMARGGNPGIGALPVDYWDADIAWRIWARAKAAGNVGEVRGCEAWFEKWLRMRAGEWADEPSGSLNHTWAQVLGAYAAVQVLGQARANAIASGVAKNAVADMRRLVLERTWPCCGGGHPNDRGEITGSRHYHIRAWSDETACADLCEPDLAKSIGEQLDSAVAFLNGKVRRDGIWPEDIIPRVRPERDLICYWPPLNKADEWPDPAIRRKYPELTAHPAFTPHTSYLILDYVTTVNTDFIGHYKPSICRSRNKPDWCDNIGGQGTYPDECDERGEVNNVGLLIAGDKWRPKRTGR